MKYLNKKKLILCLTFIMILAIILRFLAVIKPIELYIYHNLFILDMIIIIMLYLIFVKKINMNVLIVVCFWAFVLSGLINLFVESKVYRYDNVGILYKYIANTRHAKGYWLENDNYALLVTSKNELIRLNGDNKVWKKEQFITYYQPFAKCESDDFEAYLYNENDTYFLYLIISENISIDKFKDNLGSDFKELKKLQKKNDKRGRYGLMIDGYENYEVFYSNKQIIFNKID